MSTPSMQGALHTVALPTRAYGKGFVARITAQLMGVVEEVQRVSNAMNGVPSELGRMADQFEPTRPELAKRLRKAARNGWRW